MWVKISGGRVVDDYSRMGHWEEIIEWPRIFKRRFPKQMKVKISELLFPKQQIVFYKKAAGYTEPEIATQLKISRGSVETHWKRLKEKLIKWRNHEKKKA